MEFCKVTLTFESVDEILWCDHSNESYWAVLSCGTVYYAVQGDSNFWVCGRNPMMRPFKWKPSACTFTYTWCYLFLTILENEIWKFGRNLPLTTFDSERVNYSSATTWFVAQQVQTWVVKGATVLFDMFCSNAAKLVARCCCCPLYRTFSWALIACFCLTYELHNI